MTQGSAHSFQLLAEVLLVERLANSQGQLSEMLPFDAVENTVSGQLRERFTCQPSRHKEKRNLPYSLMKELQTLWASPTRAWELGHHDLIRLGAKLLRALLQGRNGVGADDELRFRELLQAVVYDLRIVVNEKDADMAEPVRGPDLRPETDQVRR